MRNAFALLLGAWLAGAGGGAMPNPAPWPHAESLIAAPPAPHATNLRVFLDAGHGAPDNTGNRSSYCEDEERFTSSLAADVADALQRAKSITVMLSRRGDQRPTYQSRVEEARRFGADVFISLHSDVRARGTPWAPAPGLRCLRDRSAPGFSVLYSDAGPTAATNLRRGFARALAQAMTARGFGAFTSYARDYDDDDTVGVFLDRHAPGRRIYVLEAPPMPSVIVETHHALDDREVRLWRAPHTRRAFAAAIADALTTTFPARGPS